ncbi:MAG: YkgJ family cysteine cluster protein [Myxococcales bacterium]|nr:YkgJ family cysteine cluster protein [Myxococcales bacterium]
MRDGPGRYVLKRGARAWFELELGVARRLRRLRGRPRFELAGECRGCARCCEAPSIRVGRVLWYFPTLRRLFLRWQRSVNGFELLRAERQGRLFVFRCSHFDWESRRCDSYASRPGICRDYPQALFDQPWPQLFEECGYRPRDRVGDALGTALQNADIPVATRRLLRKKLHLE